MTKANFREGHPNIPFNPNLAGHQQKSIGRVVLDSLPIRTEEFVERFVKHKDNIIKNSLGHYVFNNEEKPLDKFKKHKSKFKKHIKNY